MKIHRRFLLPITIAVTSFLTLSVAPIVKASPYASGVTNNTGTVSFYLNESGGSVLVTYEDGTSNNVFDGMSSGATNLASGSYNFSLGSHSSYAIAVTKFSTNGISLASNVVQIAKGGLFGTNNMRGVDINKNPASPYFGRIYLGSESPALLWDFNSDGSFASGGPGQIGTNCGIAWQGGSTFSSPYRMSVGPDDSLWVSDLSSAASTIWKISSTLATTNLVLGSPGWVNGYNANIHVSEESRPVVFANPTTGTNLLVVDGDWGDTSAGAIDNINDPETHANAILVYSNMTTASFPRQTGPDLVGLSVSFANLSGTSLAPIYIGLSACSNGYVYASQLRSSVNVGDPAFLQVYSVTNYTQVWNSRYNGGASDYFFTTATGSSGEAPADSAVSPDGKYVATIGLDNHIAYCALTNGLPDVSTIKVSSPTSLVGNGRGLCWDAADNIYTISSGESLIQEWTLGLSTTFTTAGNASGVTNFTSVLLIPSVSVYATNAPAISQNNTHGNPTSGAFTIVRSGGNIGAPLTINFTYSGTATNGTYTAGSSGSVVLAAGQTTTNILITAVTDGAPRLTTYLTLNISSGGAAYNIVTSAATISILNTATPYLTGSVSASTMYNAFSNDFTSMTITRLGDTNTTETVSSFTVAGTAVEGTDYTAPTPVTFVPGDLTHITYIYPLVGGQVPVHNPNLPFTGNKTVVLGISNGSGYNGATNTAALTIIDSANPPAPVLFADALTNYADSNNWAITAANGNLDNISPPDIDVEFGCNLTNTPFFFVPFPPNGATNALKMTVNKDANFGDGLGDVSDYPMTAVNAYLTNMVFSNNYAVRFNMNIIQGNSTNAEQVPGNGGETYEAEEGPLFGINASGTQTNWWAGDKFALSDAQTNFGADGIWYWISDDGGNYLDTASYQEYAGFSALPNNGWTNLATHTASNFVTAFKTNVFTCYASINVPPAFNSGWTEGGPGLPANGPPTLGLSANSWSDAEMKQVGGVVTLSIDKVPIFTYTNTTTFTSGLAMLGFEDPYSGDESADTAVYFSNLQVVQLGPPAISGTTLLNSQTSTLSFKFTTSDGSASASSFAIVGATVINGPYTTVSGATITLISGNTYQVTVPTSGPIHFYRVNQLH